MSEIKFENLPKDLQKALKRSDVLVGKKTLDYYYDLYDSETGGFYYSGSSRDMEKMTPFAEGTCFVLTALRDGGITLPDWYKEKVTSWLIPHQDESDGYFYETLWGKITKGARINRDLVYSRIIIKDHCGRQLLYKTPDERIVSATEENKTAVIPEHLQSKEAVLKYLESLDWTTPKIWGTGQTLITQAGLIRAAGLEETVCDHIRSRQNQKTGLWGGGSDAEGDGDGLTWMNTNGTMKLSGFFQDEKHPFPLADKMIESVKRVFESGTAPNLATNIWNPFVAITCALVSVGEKRAGELRSLLYEKGADMVNFAIDAAEKLRKSDGGFSSFQGGSIARQQGYLFGAGLPDESDLDGTVIAGHLLRSQMHRVFGVKADSSYLKEYEEEFWEKCKNKAPIKKTLPRGSEPLNPPSQSPLYYEPIW